MIASLHERRRAVLGLATSLAVGWMMAVALVLGCGRKASPKPPDLVAPTAVTDLSVVNEANGVRLSWSRPSRHADGTPLEGLGSFVVERAHVGEGARFEVIATLEVPDSDRFRKTRRFKYLDSSPELGARYIYRVIAVTTDGYASEPSNPASLQPGQPAASPTP